MRVLSKLGVVVTNIAPGELYTALDRGTIDALEWVGPSLDLNMGFQKIAPYYYTGWHEPATELQFMVNKAAFDALPAHLQEILTIAMQYAAYDMYARSYHESAVNWASIEKEYPDVKIRTFSPEIIAAMKQAQPGTAGGKCGQQSELQGNSRFTEGLHEDGAQVDRDF